jgi:hypothetical protein
MNLANLLKWQQNETFLVKDSLMELKQNSQFNVAVEEGNVYGTRENINSNQGR